MGRVTELFLLHPRMSKTEYQVEYCGKKDAKKAGGGGKYLYIFTLYFFHIGESKLFKDVTYEFKDTCYTWC